jgi:hypothetical protein
MTGHERREGGGRLIEKDILRSAKITTEEIIATRKYGAVQTVMMAKMRESKCELVSIQTMRDSRKEKAKSFYYNPSLHILGQRWREQLQRRRLHRLSSNAPPDRVPKDTIL